MSADKQDNFTTPLDAKDAGTSVSRRSLLRRSLRVVPPAVATLASAPVSAGICLNPTGFVSGPTFASRHPGMGENCAGQSPAIWISNVNDWPKKFGGAQNQQDLIPGDLQGLGSGTKFNVLFNPSLTQDKSLLVVLNGYGAVASMDTIAAAIVALWLNVKTNRVGGVFTVGDARAYWQNISANNGYKPPSGPTWTLQQTQNWLALHWGQPLPTPYA